MLTTSIQHESTDLIGKLMCMTCKQSLSSDRIGPNGHRKRAGSTQHFCFHWAAKCDGSLWNRPKSDPI